MTNQRESVVNSEKTQHVKNPYFNYCCNYLLHARDATIMQKVKMYIASCFRFLSPGLRTGANPMYTVKWYTEGEVLYEKDSVNRKNPLCESYIR